MLCFPVSENPLNSGLFFYYCSFLKFFCPGRRGERIKMPVIEAGNDNGEELIKNSYDGEEDPSIPISDSFLDLTKEMIAEAKTNALSRRTAQHARLWLEGKTGRTGEEDKALFLLRQTPYRVLI